jgi:hypothetical protein
VGDPNVPSGEVATVEHAAPLLALGTVIVPVKPLGAVPTLGDAPRGKPFGPTDSPGTIPNEEVAPSEGMVVPTWAKAGTLHNDKEQAAAIARSGLMEDIPAKSEWIPRCACASTAVGKTTEAWAFFFIIVGRG